MKLYTPYSDSFYQYFFKHNILFYLIFLTFFLAVIKIFDPLSLGIWDYCSTMLDGLVKSPTST